MIKILVKTMIVLVITLFLVSSALSFSNEPVGVFGLKWGCPLEFLDGLKPLGTDSTGLEKFQAGPHIFFFSQNRFVAAAWLLEPQKYEAVKADLVKKYGEPVVEGKDKEITYAWNGKLTNIRLYRFYDKETKKPVFKLEYGLAQLYAQPAPKNKGAMSQK